MRFVRIIKMDKLKEKEFIIFIFNLNLKKG